MRKITIAGGTGFLGKALTKYFTSKGDHVIILSRNRDPQDSNEVYWDGKTLGPWTETIDGSDILINLAGKSVDCRYTTRAKEEIISSRINSTKVLALAITQCQSKPRLWINASSATIYNHSLEQPMCEEKGAIGHDFSMNVVKAWEKTFFDKHIEGIRKIALRTSIVLGTEGGAFPKLTQITRIGLGGQQGSGEQMVSWIHIDDFCRAVDFLSHAKALNGVINITAPFPIRNKNLMSIIRKLLKMSLHFPQPKWLLEIGALFMRTETELILKSRYVVPKKLEVMGFIFQYPDIKTALKSLLHVSTEK